MRYYTRNPKKHRNMNFKQFKVHSSLLIVLIIIIAFNFIIYIFGKRILPIVLNMGEVKIKSEAVKIMNEESVNVYSENFKYDDIINIEKDADGNITMIRSDTVKQNYLASQVVLKCDERLSELEDLGVKIPLGYLTNNVMFYNMGPKITVKMQQVGNITTSYESEFQSAGINQTRHKIYLNLTTTMRVIVPFNSKEVEVTCQIPVSDTIIVGKIPETAINMNGSNSN
ncbi:sporulation protein YunB [uncultured Clostridium sp.]|uniref:sporulation protein YunB n=1 Tax=uncultured Clostridium sp. TaxID=59620 RepID=UPI00280B034A|nr:sporulation protein YunB [uncultured Clostridium sp.]MDU7077507.1 sporulation protein YunB [Clostridium celatum]